ncbi:hypothetical protein [Polaromonas sp. AER18D-145]|uniref:hypothetical protein n=1 Tax=Polaromonas sp. AER18D-145 TaxID=1977060 RepID=UPI0014837638|nr:hypothetical protein [Polaromonas sp. AER18D-145]
MKTYPALADPIPHATNEERSKDIELLPIGKSQAATDSIEHSGGRSLCSFFQRGQWTADRTPPNTPQFNLKAEHKCK